MKEHKHTITKTKVDLLKESEQELRHQLILGAELLIQVKGTDEALDRRIEKVQLLSGETVNLIEYNKYIASKINAYHKRFPQAFYQEVFRLMGWHIPQNGIISHKPSIVGKFTKQIIYGRFPKEILPAIENKNQYDIMGMRSYKHFQFLTPEGVELLERYIEDAIIIMKKCKYWNEFVEMHAKNYGNPFQSSLFPYND